MKKCFYVFLLLLVATQFPGCTERDSPGAVYVFNNTSIKTYPFERVVSIKPEKQTEFNAFFKDLPCQFPVLKIIENPSYTIFLNIPVGANLPEMARHYRLNSGYDSTMTTDSVNYLYWSKSIGDSYITQTVFQMQGNLLSLNIINNDKLKQDSLFTFSALQNRIIQTK